METDSPNTLNPFERFSTAAPKVIAYDCGVAPTTVIRWCKEYKIGAQIEANKRWVVSVPAAKMIASADPDALRAFQAGNFNDPAVTPYLKGEGA